MNPIDILAKGGQVAQQSMSGASASLQGALSATQQMSQTSQRIVEIANQSVSIDMKMYELALENEKQKFNELMQIRQYALEQWSTLKKLQLQKLQMDYDAYFRTKGLELQAMRDENDILLRKKALEIDKWYKENMLDIQNQQLGLEAEKIKLMEEQNIFDRFVKLKQLEINASVADANLALDEKKAELTDTQIANVNANTQLTLAKVRQIENQGTIPINILNGKDVTKDSSSVYRIPLGDKAYIGFDPSNPKNSISAIQKVLSIPNLDDNVKKQLTFSILEKTLEYYNYDINSLQSTKNGKTLLTQLGSTPEEQKANMFKMWALSRGLDVSKINITDPKSVMETFKTLDKNEQTKRFGQYFLDYVKTTIKDLYKNGKIDEQTFNSINRISTNIKVSTNLFDMIDKDKYDKVANFVSNKPTLQANAILYTANKCGSALNCNEISNLTEKILNSTGYGVTKDDVGSAVRNVLTGTETNKISELFGEIGNFFQYKFGLDLNQVTGETTRDIIKRLDNKTLTNTLSIASASILKNKSINQLANAYNISPADIVAFAPRLRDLYADKFWRKDNKIMEGLYDFSEEYNLNPQAKYNLLLDILKYQQLKQTKRFDGSFNDFIKQYDTNMYKSLAPIVNEYAKTHIKPFATNAFTLDDMLKDFGLDINDATYDEFRDALLRIIGIASYNKANELILKMVKQ